MLRATQDTPTTHNLTRTGLSPSAVTLSNVIPVQLLRRCRGPITPLTPKRQRFGLFRVRSPLLAESQLFSLPTGTKMFQFPAFAHSKGMYMVFNHVGCPIRKSPDQRSFAPTRSLSQLTTSFVASYSQGIHRPPLLSFSSRLLSSYRYQNYVLVVSTRMHPLSVKIINFAGNHAATKQRAAYVMKL